MGRNGGKIVVFEEENSIGEKWRKTRRKNEKKREKMRKNDETSDIMRKKMIKNA